MLQRGLDLIPDQIFAKLKRGKPLLTIEVCLIQALQQLQVEARKEKLDRMNLWKATRKKPDRWVAKRKRTEDDELKRSKRRSTNAVPSVISVNESKLNARSQTSPESYHAPQTLSKKRSKKLDDIESFMEEEKDIAERVKEHRQTCKQKYEKSVEDESSKKKSEMLDDLDLDMEEEKDIVEKVKKRRQICNHSDKKVEADSSKKESENFDYLEFNEEKKDSAARVKEHSQTFNHKGEKAFTESFSAEESFSDEDLPALIKIVKTQQRPHQIQVKDRK